MASKFVADDQMNAVLTEWKLGLRFGEQDNKFSFIYHIYCVLWAIQIGMSSKELCVCVCVCVFVCECVCVRGPESRTEVEIQAVGSLH